MKIRAPFGREANAVEKTGELSKMGVESLGILVAWQGSVSFIFHKNDITQAKRHTISVEGLCQETLLVRGVIHESAVPRNCHGIELSRWCWWWLL